MSDTKGPHLYSRGDIRNASRYIKGNASHRLIGQIPIPVPVRFENFVGSAVTLRLFIAETLEKLLTPDHFRC